MSIVDVDNEEDPELSFRSMPTATNCTEYRLVRDGAAFATMRSERGLYHRRCGRDACELGTEEKDLC